MHAQTRRQSFPNLWLIVQLDDIEHVLKAARVEHEIIRQPLYQVLLQAARVALQPDGTVRRALTYQRRNKTFLLSQKARVSPQRTFESKDQRRHRLGGHTPLHHIRLFITPTILLLVSLRRRRRCACSARGQASCSARG